MEQSPQTFPRDNRLRTKSEFAALFESGKPISNYPVKTIFLFTRQEVSVCQFGISVPKRNFKRAVKRNRIKRLMREVIRKRKSVLEQACKDAGLGLKVLFVYQNNQLPDYELIDQKLIHSLNKLLEKCEETRRGETAELHTDTVH